MQDLLLERLVGNWVLRGAIDGRLTTHDISAEWVLGHNYLRLLEVSREKDTAGQPAYDAIVLIGWDERTGEYTCLWLDSTSGAGLSAATIGRARPGGDEIPFLFRGGAGSLFHTTFAYDRATGSWTWRMESEENGKQVPFARVTLTRE